MKIESQKIPVFIINMKKDIDKKKHMQTLCEKFNLEFEFIEAVDGRLLNDKEIEAVYSKKQMINNLGRELTKGEIGCALSHILIYKKIVTKNIQTALILEDDIDFDQKLIDCLNSINQFPDDWELILLGHHSMSSRKIVTPYNFWYKKYLNKTNIIRKPSVVGGGTYGYCINNKGAKKLLGHLQKIAKPIDHYTGSSQYVNLYIIQKPIININQELTEQSNLFHDREEIAKNYSSKTIVHKSIKRKVLDFFGLYKIATIIYIPLNNFKMFIINKILRRIKPLRKYQ
jgi:glycosyl transferase family 25